MLTDAQLYISRFTVGCFKKTYSAPKRSMPSKADWINSMKEKSRQ